LNIIQQPSTGFVSVLCQEIKTTANYTGNITIQFAFNPTGLSLKDKQSMKIWFWNTTSQTWVDITTHVDTVNNIVYGVTSHLSIYGVTSDISLEGNFLGTGEITAKTVNSPSNPPAGLMLMKCYDIETTMGYTGNLTLRIAYNESAVTPEQESFIRMWRWNNALNTWLDITTYVDTASNIVYGKTTHLSIYGVTSLKPLPPKIAVIDAKFSKTVVGQGYKLTVNFSIQNQGDFAKTFDVVVYRNLTVIATYTASNLQPNATIPLSYTWITTNWAMGNYTISACNQATGQVFVTIPGDVDGNHAVNILDVVKITSIYATKQGDPKFNPNADIDGDGTITILDVVSCTSHYAQKWP
jgi:hypothetical protein